VSVKTKLGEIKMTNVNEMYPSSSKYLKASDLKDREIRVKIAGHEVAKFDNGNKVVLTFEGKERGLTLNKTNAMKIAAAYGEDIEGWRGQEVIMYPDKTDYQGSLVDCIRVRIPPKAGDDFSDDIPFNRIMNEYLI
jgi:hypothetical protein